MKIKTYLTLTAFISIGLVLVMAVSLFFYFFKMEQTSREGHAASSLLKEIAELVLVTDDYLAYQYERNLQQWENKYSQIADVIAGNPSIFKTIDQDIKSLSLSFKILQASFEEPNQKANNIDLNWINERNSILRERAQGRVRVLSSKIFSDTFKIFQDTVNRKNQLQQSAIIIFAGLSIFLIIVISFTHYITIRKLTRPIKALVGGTKIIGKGELNYQISLKQNYSKEFKQLIEHFNLMAAKLSRSDASLRESEAKYKQIYKNIQDVYYEISLEGNILEISPSIQNISGYKREDLIGKSIYAFYAIPEERDQFIQVILKKHTIDGYDITLKRKDGLQRICSIVSVLIKDEKNNPIKIVGSMRDISERKKAEEALIHQQQILRAIIDNIPVLITLYDPKAKILLLNKAFEISLGWSNDEMKHLDIMEECYPDQDYRTKAFEYMQRASTEWREFKVKTKSGLFIDCIWSNVRLKDGTRIGIGVDITEKKHLEANLQQAYKMESIGNLAGGIAHDFNNVLSSIIGFTELSLEDVEKGTPLEGNLQEVYSAGKRARDLVKQILAFARQSNEERKPIQVDTIAKEVLKLIRSTIPTTVQIKENIESHSLIMGNQSQIHQIFMNLCTNAAQAMENTGGILDVKLSDVELDVQSISPLSKLKYGNYLKITVSDTGPGIPQHIIGSIFEPYFTTKGVGEGTGMGLAMVHGIVESYGGEIVVDSKLGQGTVFKIYLPSTNKGENHRKYENKKLPSGTEAILFVDDELPIAKMGSQTLERLGYQVTVRTSSVEALEIFRSKPQEFDLVISDITMPNITGDQLAVELMKIRPTIPVILFTGYSKKMSEEKAAEIGIKAFAYKPIVKADLAKTVRRVLDETKKQP